MTWKCFSLYFTIQIYRRLFSVDTPSFLRACLWASNSLRRVIERKKYSMSTWEKCNSDKNMVNGSMRNMLRTAVYPELDEDNCCWDTWGGGGCFHKLLWRVDVRVLLYSKPVTSLYHCNKYIIEFLSITHITNHYINMYYNNWECGKHPIGNFVTVHRHHFGVLL